MTKQKSNFIAGLCGGLIVITLAVTTGALLFSMNPAPVSTNGNSNEGGISTGDDDVQVDETTGNEIIDSEIIDSEAIDSEAIDSETSYEIPPVTNDAEPDFTVFSFYLPENHDIYVQFLSDNPELDLETVVWMVNAHLHLPFFGVIIVNNDPNPLLVNSFYRLPDGFVPADLVDLGNGITATRVAATAFDEMSAAIRAAGMSIAPASGYRPAARQATLWEQQGRRDGAVMRPHHSEHQTGRAIDLWGNTPNGLLDSNGATPAGTWVAENAHRFGFILRYRADTTNITGIMYEPWHITYVGLEISMYMFENNILSLEEFVAKNPNATIGGFRR